MKTTKRFENAVSKLYNAFHENRLEALDCTACAVGNILNNKDEWSNIFSFGKIFENEFDRVDTLKEIKQSGYSVNELAEVEIRFIYGTSIENYLNEKFDKTFFDFKLLCNADKDRNFKGLCAVVEYLAELDNIPNPMDYSKLFETENENAKYSLVEVFN